MQKADFEKNVQQKMQELRFPPSDGVWKRVEAAIPSRRRRRPVVLWLLVAGLMLAGGSYYFINRQYRENISRLKREQPGQSIAEKQSEKDQQLKTSAQPGSPDHDASSEINQVQKLPQPSIAAALKNEPERKKNNRDQSVPIQSKNKKEQVLRTEKDLAVDNPIHPGNLFSTDEGLRI
ncbi:MAG TPA: hypothetical protein VEV87_05025, partial [Chitinophagaceae bacterium]|nr:hypothetical protein [Chitinophagaceae bacterium]